MYRGPLSAGPGFKSEGAAAQPGLPEMVGNHEGQISVLTRENGREVPKWSCYYATL